MHEANVNPIRSSMHFMYILRARFVYTFRINNEQPGNSSALPPLKRSSWIILGSQIELRFLSSNLHVSKIPRIVRVSQASRNQPRAWRKLRRGGEIIIRQRSVKRKRRHVPLANETQRVEFWKNANMLRVRPWSHFRPVRSRRKWRERGEGRDEEENGRWDGSLSAVCRIFMQMRLHEVHKAVLILAVQTAWNIRLSVVNDRPWRRGLRRERAETHDIDGGWRVFRKAIRQQPR